MLVLIGASASGKTEIAKLLVKNHGMHKITTYTTRPMRKGEINHKDYHFIEVSTFQNRNQEKFFLETTAYQGHYYGTAFEDAKPGAVVIVDPRGANAIQAILKKRIVVVLITSDSSLREQRMINRGDAKETIEMRLNSDDKTFHPSQLNHLDAIFANENQHLENLAEEIYQFYIKRLSSNLN